MSDERTEFPPPWSVEKIPDGLKVCDANGQSLAYVYSRENPNDAHMANVLTEDEARRIASNIAKLPDLLGKGGLTRRLRSAPSSFMTFGELRAGHARLRAGLTMPNSGRLSLETPRSAPGTLLLTESVRKAIGNWLKKKCEHRPAARDYRCLQG